MALTNDHKSPSAGATFGNDAILRLFLLSSDPISGTCVFEHGLLNPFCVDVNNSTTTHLLMLYVVLMYFWTAAFVHAFNMYIMVYAVAVWYFSPVGSSGHQMLPHGNTFCDCRLFLRAVGGGINR